MSLPCDIIVPGMLLHDVIVWPALSQRLKSTLLLSYRRNKLLLVEKITTNIPCVYSEGPFHAQSSDHLCASLPLFKVHAGIVHAEHKVEFVMQMSILVNGAFAVQTRLLQKPLSNAARKKSPESRDWRPTREPRIRRASDWGIKEGLARAERCEGHANSLESHMQISAHVFFGTARRSDSFWSGALLPVKQTTGYEIPSAPSGALLGYLYGATDDIDRPMAINAPAATKVTISTCREGSAPQLGCCAQGSDSTGIGMRGCSADNWLLGKGSLFVKLGKNPFQGNFRPQFPPPTHTHTI